MHFFCSIVPSIIIGISTLCRYSLADRFCYDCKSRAIATYWDSFYNRRIVTGGDEIIGTQECDRAVVVPCKDSCYSISATTVNLRSGTIVRFGLASGCTTGLFPTRYNESSMCERRDIRLRRIRYDVHAKYCFCNGNGCNWHGENGNSPSLPVIDNGYEAQRTKFDLLDNNRHGQPYPPMFYAHSIAISIVPTSLKLFLSFAMIVVFCFFGD